MSNENMIQILGREDASGAMYFRTTVTMADGQEVTKVLSYEDMLKFFNDSYRQAEAPMVPIGTVPEGYLDGKIDADGKGVVRILVMGGKHHPFFQYQMGQKMPRQWDIAWPTMIFEISFGKEVATGNAWCVKGTEEQIRKKYFAEGVETYLYPFGNISHDGHICMGNMHPKVPSMAEAGNYLKSFYEGVTNTDYLSGELANATEKVTQTELLMACEKARKFPEKLLKGTRVVLKKF